jgi:drug/metabolite transporter (DMT)-like permease
MTAIMNTHTYRYGAFLVALSALGYAFNPILAKVGYGAGANAITLSLFRFTFATVGLWVIGRAWRHALTWQQRISLVLLGALGFATVSLLFFTAVAKIDASLATGLFYTHPAMIVAVGRLRGERMSWTGYGGLFLTGAGTWLLLGSALGGFQWQGFVLILLSAVLYSGYILVGERVSRGVPPRIVSAHVTLGAAMIFLLLALATHQTIPQPVALLASLGLAVLSTMLAMSAFFAGLALVGPTRASMISMLEPVFTALLALPLLNERLGPWQIAGIALVVLGAAAAHTKEPAVAI